MATFTKLQLTRMSLQPYLDVVKIAAKFQLYLRLRASNQTGSDSTTIITTGRAKPYT